MVVLLNLGGDKNDGIWKLGKLWHDELRFWDSHDSFLVNDFN